MNQGILWTLPMRVKAIAASVASEGTRLFNLQPGDVLQKIDGETVPDVTSPIVALMTHLDE